ncbi:MAG: DHH family phosphoesterase [Eubacteriales bacterium]
MFTIEESAKWLIERDNFLILTHRSPDGDTIGCGAGLCLALREQGKTAYLLENEDITPSLQPYVEGLTSTDFEGDYIVSVDIATEDLFPNSAKKYCGKVDLAIDHHPMRDDFGKENCVYSDSASAGEIIYRIVSLWGEVSAAVALPLYVAVSTDTGCFVFGNTTPESHYVAGKLIEKGLDVRAVNKVHFQTVTICRLRLESRLLGDMKLFDGGKIAIVCVTLAMLKELGATEDDTENLSAFVSKIQGVNTGITIREKEDGICRISMRTIPTELKANEVCARLGGGGHAAASGAAFHGSVQGAVNAMVEAIEAVSGNKLTPS